MNRELKKDIKNNKMAFEAFNKLAVNVFNLSFEAWYEKGYWGDKYFPYTLFEGERAIANVSASMIHTMVNGEPKLYIQIGTVMAHDNYRKGGLSRRLLQELIEEWQDKCDGIYLYANDTVLDFYPKFGFMPKDTKECKVAVLENEDQLFIYTNKENMFNKSKMMLPLLSHA